MWGRRIPSLPYHDGEGAPEQSWSTPIPTVVTLPHTLGVVAGHTRIDRQELGKCYCVQVVFSHPLYPLQHSCKAGKD